jgi:hypothetical protein
MKRKAFALTLFLLLLVSLLAGTLLNQNGARTLFVKAEASNDNMVIYESTNIANVTIQSPENKTYNENNVTLTFTIESDIPPVENFSGNVYALYYVHGCVLDNNTSKLVYDVSHKYYVSPNNVPVALSGSGNRYVGNATLTGLSQGPHNITVGVRAQRYMISYAGIEWSVFSTVSFSVAPQITVLSPETKAYNVSDVPLDFTVEETFSRIEYSLDGQGNVTIDGNTTLTWLPNGDHNVTVYATDEFGNTGVSKTIYFDVEAPFPTVLVVAVSVAAVVVVGMGLFIYLKKRKR